MSLSELDVLLALCKAASLLEDAEKGERLLLQITPYIEEAYNQIIAPSPFLRSIEPSPWEALSYHLVSAALVIGIKYPTLHASALESTTRYLRNCMSAMSTGQESSYEHDLSPNELPMRTRLSIAALSVSLVGFLNAASEHAEFYDVSEMHDLVATLRGILSEGFMVSVEGVFSSIRTADSSYKRLAYWQLWARRYAASGRPLGAMLLQCGLMELLVSCSSLQIATRHQLQRADILFLVENHNYSRISQDEATSVLLEILSDTAAEEMRLLEDGADYLQLGSTWQQQLAFSVKAHALHTFLNCTLVDESVADLDTLVAWLEDTMVDPVQMADENVSGIVLRSMAVVAKLSPAVASTFSRSLPRFIVQSGIKGETVIVAARTLTYILQMLSQDAVITGLYSLGNVLSGASNAGRPPGGLGSPDGATSPQGNGKQYGLHPTTSAISLDLDSNNNSGAAYSSIVRAIVGVASSCKDNKITALAQSMLVQKLGKIDLAVDIRIITETATLATSGNPSEFRTLLKLYARISHEGAVQRNTMLIAAVLKARLYLSTSLGLESPLFEAYLIHLLESIISKGDVHESDNTHQADVELAASEIVELLPPLATLVAKVSKASYLVLDPNIRRLYREAWFNIVVHGIAAQSGLGQQYDDKLRAIAIHSPPLVADDRADEQYESEIELNSILRRGMNPPHTAEQKRRLITLLPKCESDIRSLSYAKVIFLSAAYLVEVLRADGGDCTSLLPYFLDPSLNGTAMENCMGAIADEVMDVYLRKTLSARYENNASPRTYLADYDDDGAYGHIALGRSFASEMGAIIPTADQKLGAIDRHGGVKINTASDFIAQYTTRQEYKYADALPKSERKQASRAATSKAIPVALYKKFADHREEQNGMPSSCKAATIADIDQQILANLERNALEEESLSTERLRDVLRRAAALLCRSKSDHCDIVHHLVGLPFSIFTKQSIKLGIALWLGVINENSRMEPRILAEVAENWVLSIRNERGIFSNKLSCKDPFYVKEEFAPSDKNVLFKRQQAAHDLIAPHLRILQFLASHFNATRLSSPHLQRVFHRIIVATLEGLQHCTGHPLAREVHFQIIMLALSVLRHSTALHAEARWKFKDSILSAALRWFSHPPRWSFGGNRLQIKAETRLLADVESALHTVWQVGLKVEGNFQSLAAKQELLCTLLENEQMRLAVWLHPLDYDKKNVFSLPHSNKAPHEVSLIPLLKTAWIEHPSLAVQIAVRFPSMRLSQDVRALLLDNPERAIDEPDALQILLGPSLPLDIGSQLKFLLYWAAVNPITAVTYFLPEYGNHPFLVQYAMRALESHSVDVTFFYVPQIVQSLRYDALGYVQRYIIETAKVSQLFAHQIIWNMRANAYKDEDSSIEDPLKPTLDLVMDNMINSFSGSDKTFYEREFSFFNEITDISGKLRPFIKKSKPEKKQKIEEELRKIKVEVGVYLPSNPDGTVIGIDRKSGKPLQSHAKAPYMATFRIKKSIVESDNAELLQSPNVDSQSGTSKQESRESTFEIWQSAIFKVGDDCRQDILALQLIAAFRGIFNNVGLDVYVYPYRVTATAPGCGVIDVLPNSISRDMLGREAVNGLYDYFISKYGAETSIRFQEARINFVKSMAAYSVISYLLQFKDRHNGNIMIDDEGHILHIDFGFCFDIAPGGVRFERAPFKLTSEMVAVMGGSNESQSYRWFEELCVKSFLASRQHTEKLCHIVVLMLGSGLPCFKPDTVAHLRQRFVLEKNEREAAEFMRDLIKKSHKNFSTRGYDSFQLVTNGIPH
ncbi:MAG: hypothetical protein Q9191_000544 [Dirinaria sp. TL-2023a]